MKEILLGTVGVGFTRIPYLVRLGLRLSMVRLLLICIMVFSAGRLAAQDFSNKGKEFWLGYGNHQQMYAGNGQGMDVYITSDQATTASVSIPGTGFNQTVNIVPNQVVSVTIPQNAILSQEGKTNTGIYVKAEKPVVVYAHIYFQSVSGATLCLPVSTLGRDYFSVNFTQVAQANLNANSYSYFFVVATEDNTTVELVPSAVTSLGKPAGQPITETLNRGEIYQVLSNADLTGSTIRSVNTGAGCKKIAVFSGSGRIGIGCSSNSTISSDNLFQQMYPTSTWGKKYITVPSANRPRNFYRIIRPDPSSQVSVNGIPVPAASFVNNLYHEIESATTQVIESDKPILVAQYFTTQSCGEGTQNGDPEMIFLNPLEQTIRDVTLTSMRLINPNNQRHYLNIVLRNLPEVLQSFRLDDLPAGSFTPLPQDPNYAYAQIEVSQGTHRLTCDSGFNAIAYGFASFESYGYSAGTNLRDLYQFITINNVLGKVNFPAACRNSPFTFSIVFPYRPLSIRWNFNGLFRDTTIQAPQHDSSWIVNDRVLYRYTISRNYTASTVGSFPINIVANNPTADGCGGEQEIDYDLQIFDRPVADFSITHNRCVDDTVKLLDISTNTGNRPVIGWNWVLGDGQGAAQKGVVHKYGTGGSYRIGFNIVTDIGCLSDTAFKTINVSNLPVANFSLPDRLCEGQPFTIQDGSTQTSPDRIAGWRWDLGNGVQQNRTTGDPIVYRFDTAGTYSIRLRVANDKDCRSVETVRQVVVGNKPASAFILPEVCLSDAFAEFIDSSRIAGNQPLTYSWDFGDGSLGSGPNPRHKYSAAAVYSVRQVVTSGFGCSDTTVKNFTVNGAVPTASFLLENAGQLCSNREIRIRNNSSVDFGSITRLQIFWDADGQPGIAEIDETPAAGRTYAHQYPNFGQPASRSYTIRVVVYSGISCSNELRIPITLLGSPQLRFSPPPPICEDAAPLAVSGATEMSGIPGTGSVSGPGINAGGLFDPGLAGPGTHRLLFRYTAGNGCVEEKDSAVVVYPKPVVDAGPDLYLLEGGMIQMRSSARGNGLNIRWSPSAGLSDPGILNPEVRVSSDTRFTLSATSSQGCNASDEVLVRVLLKPVIPNTFTPNGDGFNDRWEIRSLDSYPGCIVEVYNTTGQLVFRSVGYNQPWDGRSGGKAMAAGTYYYVIDPKNGRQKIAGYVTLIK